MDVQTASLRRSAFAEQDSAGAPDAAPPQAPSMAKVIIAGMLGNGMEWYAYALYAHTMLIFSQIFFPPGDAEAHLILTFGIFAIAFVFRPVGAIAFGRLGDRFGRRTALGLSIILMAIPTGCIGLLPTYAQIGVLSPVALIFICILQGLSMGGAFTGTMTYVIEHAPIKHRGLIGSTVKSSLIVGFLIGSLVIFIVQSLMGPEQFAQWGWRIPFVLGTAIGLVGYYIRHNCGESPVYEKAKREGALSQNPLQELMAEYLPNMLRSIGIFIAVTVPFYVLSAYFVTYTVHTLGHTKHEASLLNAIDMFILLACVPVSGWLSDQIGRRRLLMIVAAGYLLLALPIFSLLQPGPLMPIAMAQFSFALLVGFYMSPVAALFVESFPTRVRYTGMSLAYNLCAAIFGGTAPMVSEWLVNSTGSNTAIAGYVMFCACLALVALYYYPDRYKEPLA